MSYLKKAVSIMLAATMVLSLAACGKDKEAGSDEVEKSALYQETTRVLNIGSWYEQYYTSAHSDVYDNPKVDDIENAEKQLNNMRTIEKRYNVELYYNNLTWNGVIESINTSIMAGTPECDIYMVDLQFGIPAVLNSYAMSLEDILLNSQEAKDGKIEQKYIDVLSGESDVITTLQFTTDGLNYLFGGKALNLGGYTLGYNKDLIEQYALTDPYELYVNNNWTWDEWLKDMIAITQDTDGDGATDQWGWRAPWTTLTTQLLMSNGTTICGLTPDESGKISESLSSEATIEVLNFMYDMFQTYKVSFWDADCDSNWNDNVYAYGKGNIGFFLGAAWIQQEADPDQDLFESIGMVNWPVGPHGNAETNKSINVTTGTYYFIPVGIENPALVFCVMYDYTNWYDNDLELRDDTSWFEEWTYTEENFEVLKSMGDDGSDLGMDLWDQCNFSDDYQIRGIIETGSDATPITVSEFVNANKQIVQDYLDKNFNK